jgi:hypothetical protein
LRRAQERDRETDDEATNHHGSSRMNHQALP